MWKTSIQSYSDNNLPGEVMAKAQGKFLDPIPYSSAHYPIARLAFLKNK